MKERIEHKKILLISAFTILAILTARVNAFSQETPVWNNKAETNEMRSSQRQIVPLVYRTVVADIPALKTILTRAPLEGGGVNAKTSNVILILPMPDGSMQRFSIIESPVMEPGLAQRYPEIKTYLGQGVDDPSMSVRCDLTPKGFHAMMFTTEGTVFIDPYRKGDTENYISYYKKDFIPPREKFMPEFYAKDPVVERPRDMVVEVASGTTLRTYRLALAGDSAYYNFQGGTKPLTLAAMVTSMNRVNFVFEREVSIHMNIIANNDQIIFPGSTMPYPYTTTDACDLRAQNQTKIDAVIGNANYDIGHLFAMSAGGCAAFNSVCTAGSKARGVTGTNNPVGDPFDIDYVAHEMGHQFNGNHTWNGTMNSCTNDQYTASSAYEPGSGSTIMSYAGICASDNLQPHSDPYFHTRSYDQILAYSTGGSCPTTSATGNSAPSVNAGANYTIPKSTPFKLTGSGTDPDSDPLTFCWEEFDLGPAGPPNVSTTTGPIFRSFNPVTSTSRTFPKLSDILANTSTIGEILPSIGRTMTFRLTARDNRAGGGGVNYSSMTLTVDGAKGPFAVTTANSAVTWCPGPRTITWSVNGSETLAANVNILLSTDGGNTFPITLLANTANDGTESVNIPCTFSTTARIKIEAVGNVFFDISNANIQVGDNTKPTFTVPANTVIYKDADCNYNASTTITGDVTDEDDNCDNTLNATSSDGTAPGSCDGETILTRTWTLTDDCGNSTVKVQTITIRDNTPPTFTDPADITIYKDANCNHDASVGVTGDVTDEDDNCDNTLNATFNDVTAAGSCIGEQIITRTWTLADDCGNSVSKIQMILVKDTTRPNITNVNANPNTLWPPNHKMRNVTINYLAVDNCSPVTSSLSVTSNEPVNGQGDGDTAPDWLVVDNHHVILRAERSGNGNGRIYTITITATDDCGNTATTTTTVTVAHDQGRMITASEEEKFNEGGFVVKALPNPSTGKFAVTVSSDNDQEKILITVSDVLGRKLEQRLINSGSTISFGDKFIAGTYILSVTQGDEKRTYKLVKVN